jgi:hypothetical protein
MGEEVANVAVASEGWAARRGAAPVPGAEVSWFSPAVRELLARARRELGEAAMAPEPAERFRHAHLAALRAASAVVAARGRPGTRRRPQPVWDLLAVAEPDMAAWAAYFRGSSSVRAAVEAGRAAWVGPAQADHLLGAAGTFLDEVEGDVLVRAS